MTSEGARFRGAAVTAREATVPADSAAQLSDAEIMARAAEQPEWFAEIYRRHFAVIRRYLARRVAPEPADDIAAETFLRAFRSVHRYSPSYVSARPWLYGIAANILRAHFRGVYRARSADADLAGRRCFVPDPSTRATERLDAARHVNSLRRHIEALPEHERVVLVLRVELDLTYEETADLLGIPVGTVRSRLARARSRIKLQDQLAQSPPVGEGPAP